MSRDFWSSLFTFALPFLGLLGDTARPVWGDDEVRILEPPERLIVVSEQAATMAGDEANGKVPRGTVLGATRAKGRWRYAPECHGWIHLRDMVPVQEAVARFTDQIQKEPTAIAYQLRGIAWMSQDQWAKAAQDLEKSYDLGDSSVALHFNLGMCYERLGQLQAALSEYDSVLKEFPDEFPTRLARGSLLIRQGQYEPALRDFEEAIRLQSESREAQNMRGVALRMLGRYEEAIAAYTKALELNPESAEALANRGYARKSLGEFQNSREDYEKALALDPASNSIRNDFAWLLATCPEASIRDPQQAVKLSEESCQATKHKNGEYLDTLAAAYASAGNYSAAVEAAKLSLTMLANHPAASKIQERLHLYEQQQAYVEPVSVEKQSEVIPPAP